MNRDKAEKLEEEAEKYFDEKVTILKREHGTKVAKEYVLSGVHGFSFETNIRTSGEIANPEDMFYHMKAVLVENNGKDKINVLPLEDVLDAIKNDTTINYNRWF